MSERVMADRRMYLTEDRTRAVPEGDPEARFLLCTPGTYLSRADAARYGLLPAHSEPEESAADGDGKEKAQAEPPNKARTRASNKGG